MKTNNSNYLVNLNIYFNTRFLIATDFLSVSIKNTYDLASF